MPEASRSTAVKRRSNARGAPDPTALKQSSSCVQTCEALRHLGTALASWMGHAVCEGMGVFAFCFHLHRSGQATDPCGSKEALGGLLHRGSVGKALGQLGCCAALRKETVFLGDVYCAAVCLCHVHLVCNGMCTHASQRQLGCVSWMGGAVERPEGQGAAM